MFGLFGHALTDTRITFVSKAAYDCGIKEKLHLASRVEPVCRIRSLSKGNMVRNSDTPTIAVDPETFAVTVNGAHATVPPIEKVSLGQMYFFS